MSSLLDRAKFFLSYSIKNLLATGRQTIFGILCIAAGVAAIVSLQTIGVMIQTTFSGDLQESNLAGADLTGATLTGADMRWADLSGACLVNSHLGVARLRHATMQACLLDGASLRSADLSGANLRDAHFGVADCTGAVFWETRLHGADLQAVKGLTSLIEPIVIVVMGIVIGTIVVAMFMPMFGIGELASKQG